MPVCQVCSREIVPAAAPFCSHCGSPNPEAPAGPSGETDTQLLKRRLQAALGESFEVDGQLGEGGFAVVFKARDRKLSRDIAVKVLRPELTATKASKARFLREAETAARLNHPHILQIFFVGESQGLVYFGMPLVEGETLEARLRRSGPLPETEVVRIGAETADALAEAHGAGLVHRDIKPLNVMLQGARGRVLVADFGIAKAAAGRDDDKLTGTGIAIGSPHYMSPEQASGDAHVDHRSDIYSLGIVLWQMLVGNPPFERGGSQAVILQQVSRDVPPVRSRRPGVSPALEAVVARCVAKRPDDRFQSAEEVAHALRAALTGPRAAAATPVRSRRRALALGTLAVLVLVVTGILGRVLGRRGPSAGGASPRAAATAVAAPSSPAPAIAVLPFSAVTSGDTAQFGRAAALMLGEALALRNGVTTVDGNNLLARWIAERRRVTAPLDSNARFAYTLGANQMVMGNYVESGRSFRLALTMYDTHDATRLWADEITGATDSLFPLIDRIAGRVATALCGQPDYNPGLLCYNVAARLRAPLAVSVSGTDTTPVAFSARVSETGQVGEIRIIGAGVDPAIASQALQAVESAPIEPARKAGRPVASWTTLQVSVRPAQLARGSEPAQCRAAATGVKNPGGACFDSRPVPQRAPIASVPALCRAAPRPATVLVHVMSSGAVDGAPSVTAHSDCPAFDQAASTAAQRFTFEPARKAGQPVAAWAMVLVRAGQPDTSPGGR